MHQLRGTMRQRVSDVALAAVFALALAIVMTWPLAAGFDRLGRVTSDDGRYAIWNVTWVARTLVEEPARLFDANIFHPSRRALAFSELNLLAGVVGLPAWLLTGNPYATHNSVVLFAFTTSGLGAWLLARRLSGSRTAAAVAGVVFACSPYYFSHTPHIQLLLGGGIPISLLMLHRVADRPSPGRGAALGAALALQALACAYYGLFAGLMVGYAALFFAVSRRLGWRRDYWIALGAGALVAVVSVTPFFLPFLEIRDEGFGRPLYENRRYSANLASYLASSAPAHAWLLDASLRFGRWREVLFPGGVAITLGLIGAVAGTIAPRRPAAGPSSDRETVLLYGSLGVLAVWASLGPDAGLYSVLFRAVPLFSFLRAPSRIGVVVPLVLGVLGAVALARLRPRPRAAASLTLAAVAAAELAIVPFPWERAPVPPGPYATAAHLPRGPMAEFPFYGQRMAYPLHTQYMLMSTLHWQPLLNGYSDHIPAHFREAAAVLDGFPSPDSFALLRRRRVRYIGIHWDKFGPRAEEIERRLLPYAPHLRKLAADERMTLYEVMSFP